MQQENTMGPVLYLLYICDITHLEITTIVTLADDIAVGNNIIELPKKLETAIHQIHRWIKTWNVDFTNKRME